MTADGENACPNCGHEMRRRDVTAWRDRSGDVFADWLCPRCCHVEERMDADGTCPDADGTCPIYTH